VRAARISELGRLPELVQIDEPDADGERVLVEVAAVALNPVDLAVAAGSFYGGHPELPFVPGSEAVARVLTAPTLPEGLRVYVSGDGLGHTRNGTLAERIAVAEENAYPLPGGIDDAHAVAAGVAGLAGWLPVAWRSPVQEGDRVLVLGATGTVGSVAAQGAKLLGAERVVAAGRDRDRLARLRELGADATIELGEGDLAHAIADAFEGHGPTLVVDPLWGEPLAAAVRAARRGARIVSLGQSAGPETTLASADVRGKALTLLGYSNFAMTPETKRAGYLQLVDHVAAGRIEIDLETFPLDRIADAWTHQAGGRKAVVLL
jgi:NADPH2:quinone reductase